VTTITDHANCRKHTVVYLLHSQNQRYVQYGSTSAGLCLNEEVAIFKG